MAKILIVDDNRMVLQALSDRLEQMGYETDVAISGIDATRRIRANPEISSIPVVAFTSQSNRGQWDQIFDDYLVKPFGYDELGKIIKHFLDEKESESL